MKLRNVKTASLAGNKTKPIFKKLGSRNKYKASKSPTSTNNISEIEQKETLNFQNFQNSMMTLDISFNETSRNQEEYDNYALYKKYLISKTDYNKLVSEIAYVDNKIKENTKLIENLSNSLSKLKEEKKEKNVILVDLLSNKESLEEIYKIKISSLKNNYQLIDPTKVNGQIKDDKNKNNNNENPFATINILDKNDNIEINIEDIKLSDKNKFLEQVTNFTEDIAYKKDMDVRNRLMQKINVGYQRFFSEINSPVTIESSKIVTNFFSKISIFIANQNRGIYPEHLLNSFLRQLLKINRINDDIVEILKFLNKKYKDKKVEIKEKINNLINKNENLKNKKLSYENQKNELKKFIDENRDKVRNGKNKINLENGNKQCMSFIFDNHLQDDLDFLNDGKREEPLKKKKSNIDKKNIVNNNDTMENKHISDKVNQIKVLNVNHLQNKLNENCNGINNINVNNLLINNNINIENNNNIINPTDENKGRILSERLYNRNIENKLNNIPKSNNDENKNNKNVIMIKEMKMVKDLKGIPLKKIRLTPQKANVFHSPAKLNKTNFKNKILFPASKIQFYNKSISPSRARTLNFNDTNNKTFMNNSYSSNYKLLTQDISETVCFFKLSDNSNLKFNPLSSVEIDPINFNYFEGSILIDNIFNKLKITKKGEQKYIGIDLKDIVNIQLSEEMDKVIKVYNIYLKYGKNQENFDVNNFVNSNSEIKDIDMQQSDKIKAINCKYFIVTIIMGKRFVPKAEFIFNNYENFNTWFNCLQSIAKLNNPDKDKKLSTKNV